MSLYEVSYNMPFVIKTLWANKIIKRLSILNFSKNTMISLDIVELINKEVNKISDFTKEDIIKRYCKEIGSNIEHLCHFKNIKLYISTLSNHNMMDEVVIRESGFWGASSSKHMFIVNLEENLKIINSYYYNSFTDKGPQLSQFKRLCQETDIFSILYNTRKDLENSNYFTSSIDEAIDELWNMSSLVKDEDRDSQINKSNLKCKKIIEQRKTQRDEHYEKLKIYAYYTSEEIFCDNIVSLCNDMQIVIAKEKLLSINQSYGNRKNKDLLSMKISDFKKVGKSSIHVVSHLRFFHKINLCLFDNGDYYFVKMKEQEIIRKSDIISKPWEEWCILINFIEFHLKMKMSIPSDINLESQTTRFYEINSKVMAQDKPMNDNRKEFRDIWSNGNLFTYNL